ncbi:hypothetical protein BH11ACT3_BH11ACT3_18370 [soil metagenome]
MDRVQAEQPDARPLTRSLRELHNLTKAFEARLGRELAVNPTDLAAMEQLVESGPLGPAELARRLGMSRPAITASVDRLTELGHVSRAVHPTDRRGVVVTAEGASIQRVMGMLLPMISDVDAALDGFDAEQQAIIADYLERVVAAYRAHLG